MNKRISANMFDLVEDWSPGITEYSEDRSKFFFEPPMYLQRYGFLTHLLRLEAWQSEIKKVVEFGCGGMRAFPFIRNMTHVRHLVGVDIDEETVRYYHDFNFQPYASNYFFERENPLKMETYCGSFANYDANVLMNTDFVYAVEMIEHLYPETLENGMFNVFSQIAPKVAVFTTPNSDFNSLFDMTTQFRNYDHKFEWSQQQFIDWAYNLCARFPDYMVAFGGIGDPPSDVDIGPYGNCTQLAVFVRRDFWQRVTNVSPTTRASATSDALAEFSGDTDSGLGIGLLDATTDETTDQEQPVCLDKPGAPLPDANTDIEASQLPEGAYKLMFTTTLPRYVDPTTPEQNTLYTIRCMLNSSRWQEDYYNFDTHLVEVSLQDIFDGFHGKPAITLELLRRAINLSDEIKLNADDMIVWNPYEDDDLSDLQNEEDAKAYEEATELNANAPLSQDETEKYNDDWENWD